MTESELYQKHLKPLLRRKGVFFHRIEYSHIPDVYTAKDGQVLWIELKCVNRYSKIIRPDWRPGQLAFIKEHQILGGDIIILCLWYDGSMYFLNPKKEYNNIELKNKGELNYE